MDILEQNLVGSSIWREPDELINDRNNQATRKAWKWYPPLLSQNIDVVLLTNDRANYEKATQQYIHTSTTKEYFEKMAEESSKALLNLVASSGSAFKSDGPKHAGEGQIWRLSRIFATSSTADWPAFLRHLRTQPL